MENKPCGNCHKDHKGKTVCGDGVFGERIKYSKKKKFNLKKLLCVINLNI